MCLDGTQALDPLYRREIDPATGRFVGQWERIDNGGCPEDGMLLTLSAEEFRRLPITPSDPQFQPGHGRALVNMDLVAFTDGVTQELATTVLGVPVLVRATPQTFTWDFGDGSAPLVTDDPGAPYPDDTVGRAYLRTGTFEVRLTTTWSGQYQINGAGAWLPVLGTAQTTSAPFTVTAEEARTHLVAETV